MGDKNPIEPRQVCDTGEWFGFGRFLSYLVAFYMGQSLFQAMFASWQSTGWTNVEYSWANFGISFGFLLIVFMARWLMCDYRS